MYMHLLISRNMWPKIPRRTRRKKLPLKYCQHHYTFHEKSLIIEKQGSVGATTGKILIETTHPATQPPARY
jgi:hypothetical protein